MRPFNELRYAYNWHWFWDTGNGDLGNQGIHQMDVCRWGLGVDYPKRVSSGGGRYFFSDDWETPDTQFCTFDFGDKVMNTIRAIRGGRDNDPNFFTRMQGQGPWADLLRTRFAAATRKAGLGTGRLTLRANAVVSNLEYDSMTKRVTGIVKPVLSKFYRKTMKRAFVQADDEPFHYLPRYQVQVLY